ncbi:MAG: hypothetical protein U0792_07565 [Gemmataceae bacterium]
MQLLFDAISADVARIDQEVVELPCCFHAGKQWNWRLPPAVVA